MPFRSDQHKMIAKKYSESRDIEHRRRSIAPFTELGRIGQSKCTLQVIHTVNLNFQILHVSLGTSPGIPFPLRPGLYSW